MKRRTNISQHPDPHGLTRGTDLGRSFSNAWRGSGSEDDLDIRTPVPKARVKAKVPTGRVVRRVRVEKKPVSKKLTPEEQHKEMWRLVDNAAYAGGWTLLREEAKAELKRRQEEDGLTLDSFRLQVARFVQDYCREQREKNRILEIFKAVVEDEDDEETLEVAMDWVEKNIRGARVILSKPVARVGFKLALDRELILPIVQDEKTLNSFLTEQLDLANKEAQEQEVVDEVLKSLAEELAGQDELYDEVDYQLFLAQDRGELNAFLGVKKRSGLADFSQAILARAREIVEIRKEEAAIAAVRGGGERIGSRKAVKTGPVGPWFHHGVEGNTGGARQPKHKGFNDPKVYKMSRRRDAKLGAQADRDKENFGTLGLDLVDEIAGYADRQGEEVVPQVVEELRKLVQEYLLQGHNLANLKDEDKLRLYQKAKSNLGLEPKPFAVEIDREANDILMSEIPLEDQEDIIRRETEDRTKQHQEQVKAYEQRTEEWAGVEDMSKLARPIQESSQHSAQVEPMRRPEQRRGKSREKMGQAEFEIQAERNKRILAAIERTLAELEQLNLPYQAENPHNFVDSIKEIRELVLEAKQGVKDPKYKAVRAVRDLSYLAKYDYQGLGEDLPWVAAGPIGEALSYELTALQMALEDNDQRIIMIDELEDQLEKDYQEFKDNPTLLRNEQVETVDSFLRSWFPTVDQLVDKVELLLQEIEDHSSESIDRQKLSRIKESFRRVTEPVEADRSPDEPKSDKYWAAEARKYLSRTGELGNYTDLEDKLVTAVRYLRDQGVDLNRLSEERRRAYLERGIPKIVKARLRQAGEILGEVDKAVGIDRKYVITDVSRLSIEKLLPQVEEVRRRNRQYVEATERAIEQIQKYPEVADILDQAVKEVRRFLTEHHQELRDNIDTLPGESIVEAKVRDYLTYIFSHATINRSIFYADKKRAAWFLDDALTKAQVVVQSAFNKTPRDIYSLEEKIRKYQSRLMEVARES